MTTPLPRRPDVDYSDEVADRICELLAEGLPLAQICKLDGFPSRVAAHRWELDPRKAAYAAKAQQAREIGLLKMADDIVEIADDARNDWMEVYGKDDKGWKANGENVQRSRLRIETRRWLLSMLLRKIYGDKSEVTVTPGDGFEAILDMISKR